MENIKKLLVLEFSIALILFGVISYSFIIGGLPLIGNGLAKTNINLLNGAILNGRALAQTAVTLDANPITLLP